MGDSTFLEAGKRRGFLKHLSGVYLAPGGEFVHILRRPGFWAPLAVLLALNVAFTAVWLHKVEPQEFMKAQLEDSGQWDRIPADRRADLLDQQAKLFPIFGWVGAVLGAPVTFLVVGGLYLFVFRFFYASEVTFKQSLSVVGYVFVAVVLVSLPLTLLTMALKGDWNVDPRSVLQANLTLLLDKQSVPRPLYSLADSLDLFSLWILWLLSVAYGIASRRPTTSAAAGVVALWAAYVVGKVGLSFLF